MAVRRPTVEEIFRIAESYNLNPSTDDVDSYIELSQPILDSYARLDQLTAPSLPVKYPRSPGVRPEPQDNPLGAWYWRCDINGAGCHDLLGTRCDPYVHKMLNGEDFDYCCHSNLVRAVAPYHLNESDVHDVLNIFQVTGLTQEDQYFVKPSPAKRGDFFEFFAEIDLLCAISTCPHGDLSVQVWGEDAGDPIDTCHPLGVEIYQPSPELIEGWESPPTVDYRGIHGLDRP